MKEPLTIKQKIQNAVRIDRAILLVSKASPKWTLINALLVVVQGVLPLLSLYLMKLIIDAITLAVQAGASADSAAARVMLLVAAAAVIALIQAAAGKLGAYATEAQGTAVTDYVYQVMHKKSIELDLAYYENPDYYDTLHRAQGEGPYRPTAIVNGLNQLGQGAVSLVVMAGLLFTFHWAVGILLFLSTLPGLWVQILYAKKSFQWQKEVTPSERRASYFNWVLTSDSHAKEVRLFDLGGFFSERFTALRSKIRGEKLSLSRSRSLADFSAQAFATMILMGCLLLIALRTIKGMITLGDMVMYFQAFQRGVGNLKDVLQNLAGLYENNLFVAHFFAFLDTGSLVKQAETPVPVPPAGKTGLEVKNLAFSYPRSREHVLRNVSFGIRPGEVVALVGANGAGKSTLVKLLCRLYDPTGGRIAYEKISYTALPIKELRRIISVVFQDFVQYHLTAADNIMLGDVSRQASAGEIERSATRAEVHETVRSLPEGYDTMLGKWFESGEELSRGEWQKLVIARAFYRDARLVILDEPSSSLDTDTEYQLFMNFKKLIAGKSALIISHRFSTVKMADRILVLEDGTIIENGSHQELMTNRGRYAEMYEKQFAWVSEPPEPAN